MTETNTQPDADDATRLAAELRERFTYRAYDWPRRDDEALRMVAAEFVYNHAERIADLLDALATTRAVLADAERRLGLAREALTNRAEAYRKGHVAWDFTMADRRFEEDIGAALADAARAGGKAEGRG